MVNGKFLWFRTLNRMVLSTIILYLLFAIGLAWLLISDAYKLYVTPRMGPFIAITILILLWWALDNSKYVFHKTYRQRFSHLWILVLPLVAMAIPLPHTNPYGQSGTAIHGAAQATSHSNPLTKVTSTLKDADFLHNNKKGSTQGQGVAIPNGEKITNQAQVPSTKNNVSATGEKSTGATSNEDDTIPDGFTSDGSIKVTKASDSTNTHVERTGIDTANHRIVLTDKNYYRTIIELMSKPEAYSGYELVMTGYVIRDPNYADKGDFYLGRMAMVCCIADVAPFGLITFTNHPGRIPTGQWITAVGVIKPYNYKGLKQVALYLTSYSKTAPIDGYVYP